MKFLLATLAATLATSSSAFQLTMNSSFNRSPLSQQYKSITSVHNSMLTGSGGNIRMSPPPGEPEPEVSFTKILCTRSVFMCV